MKRYNYTDFWFIQNIFIAFYEEFTHLEVIAYLRYPACMAIPRNCIILI